MEIVPGAARVEWINYKEEFGDQKIDTIIHKTNIGDDELWFKGKDVAIVLGYKRTRDSLKDHVQSKNKYKLIELYVKLVALTIHSKYNINQKNTIYINKNDLIELLMTSKMPNKDIFIKWCNNKFNISCHTITRLYKEQETVGQLILAFKHLNFKTQYTVDGYRIDLYFPDHKLEIECDEHNHSDRNLADEKIREKHIVTKLNCKFIRYNPDHPNFTIFNVINRILVKIYHN